VKNLNEDQEIRQYTTNALEKLTQISFNGISQPHKGKNIAWVGLQARLQKQLTIFTT